MSSSGSYFPTILLETSSGALLQNFAHLTEAVGARRSSVTDGRLDFPTYGYYHNNI